MRRVVSVLLSLCLVCCFFGGIPVKAATLTSGDWKYTVLEDGTVEITRYTGSDEAVTIPETIEGKNVTSIGWRAFDGYSGLTSIEIPSSMTSIGDSAFDGCSGLTSIEIPEGVTSIGHGAFASCSNLENITVDKSNTVYKSEGNAIIRDNTLILGCKNTIIPEGVTSIGWGAFFGCSGLTSIEIPESVTSIDAVAFELCSNLTSITIPKGVTSIDAGAFYGCSGLTSIEIPSGVTSIESHAFELCSNLTSITIPEDVTRIGAYAFELCSNLTSITIPEGVTSIGDSAFAGCSGLTSIEIPSSVRSIDTKAFYGCSVTSIVVPKSVTSIGHGAFAGCSNLESITVDKANTVYKSEGNAIIRIKDNTLISGCKNTIIPEDVTSIGDDAFRGCEMTSIGIPSSVTSIGNFAFLGCSELTRIEIPSGVTSIGIQVFSECSSLTRIEIPEGVTSIGYAAFSDCSGLTSIEIPSSVTSIGAWAFWNCSALTSIEIPESVTSIGDSLFSWCSEELTIYGISDSYAEQYAKHWGIKFQEICKENTPVTDPAVAPTCTEEGKTEGSHCTVCGKIIKAQKKIPATGHTEEIDKEAVAPTCTTAGKTEASHCSVCGEVMKEQKDIPATGHVEEINKAVAPTCTTSGKTEGSHCAECGEVIKAQEDIPATGHTYEQTIIQATEKQDGSITEKCSVCGDVKSNISIYAASKIALSKTSLTYNGKSQKPTVMVKDSQGMALSTDSYDVTYPKTSKKVGEYTVSVTLKGNYTGTVQLKYQIVPKGTTISKLTAKKKGFTVKWKKQTKETTGYQIQYSTSSSFKGAKTITVSKNKTVSKEIKKLKAGKKYYVKIRTYKTVKVGGKNKKFYSGWSKGKMVKTKK